MKKEDIKKKLLQFAKVATVLSLLLIISYHSGVIAFADTADAGNSSDVTNKFNNLKNLVASCVSGLGTVVSLWGISEFGIALQGNDGMMQTHSFKRIAGGLIMVLAPQILVLLTKWEEKQMLDMLSQGVSELIQPFYYFGVAFWDLMLGLIGITAVQTPMTFSRYAWNYIENDLAPWTTAIGSTMLNLAFYIAIIRQSNNLKQNFTMEIFVECCIKVALGNTAMLWGMRGMKLLFGIAGSLSATLLVETPTIMAQADTDLGSALFYSFFGMVFFIVCVVCSLIIFLTVYGRFLQL